MPATRSHRRHSPSFCLALLALLALSLSAASAHASKRTAKRASEREGSTRAHAAPTSGPRVTYLTAHTAYLGLGAEDGIQIGMALQLQRHGRPIAFCQVASVSAHSASCAAVAAMKLGDAFAPPEPPHPAPKLGPDSKPRPPQPSREQVAQAKAALSAARFDQVAFSDNQSAFERLASRHLRAEISLGEAYFGVTNQSDSTFVVQTVSAAVRDAEIAGGLHASIDLTVMSYLDRPSFYRFPNNGATQVYVRQLELSYHSPTSPWDFAIGRIWPYQAPGIGVLDGAQAGWHSHDHGFEAGLLGGTVPNGINTAPTTNPLFGAYLGSTQASHGVDGSWFQANAVATAQDLPGLGFHVALDASALWSVGKWLDTSAEVRVGAGAAQAPDYVDLATFDLSLRPIEHAQLSASVRYLDNAVDQLLQPGAVSFEDGSFNASGVLSYDLSAFTIAVNGSFNRDTVTGFWRALAGADVALPKLMGRSGGLSLGFDEDFGWSEGRDAYLQAALFPGQTFQLTLRGSYFYSYTPVVPTSPAENGVSALLEARLRVARWLSVQATVYAQAAVTPDTYGTAPAIGINAAASATVRF
jgi:hypothetical protein